jgi:molybdopterin synthase sulfur carrier subunit
MIIVHVSGHLRDYTGNKRQFEIPVSSAGSVISLVQYLNQQYPGIRDRILDDQGNTREYVNIFVNGETVRVGENQDTKLKEGDLVHILPSVAGG